MDSTFLGSDEAQEYSIFEILKVAKTKTHSFDSLDRVVDAFNNTGRKTISEIIEHVIFPVVESFEKIIEVLVVWFLGIFDPLIDLLLGLFFSQMLLENVP